MPGEQAVLLRVGDTVEMGFHFIRLTSTVMSLSLTLEGLIIRRSLSFIAIRIRSRGIRLAVGLVGITLLVSAFFMAVGVVAIHDVALVSLFSDSFVIGWYKNKTDLSLSIP